MSFGKEIDMFSRLVQQAMEDTFKKVVIEVGDTVNSLSPVLTGRFKGNWQFSINSPSSQSLISYDPAGASTLSRIVAGTQALTVGQVAYIVNNLTYGYNIEIDGWPSGKPAYMPVRTTAEQFTQIVEDAVREFRV